jgi:hypothetical protein
MTVLLTAPLFAGGLTPAERDRAVQELTNSRQMFLASIAGLTPEQWNFKPAPEVWSVAECAEHILKSEDLLFDLTSHRIPATPAVTDHKPEISDDNLMKMIRDRSHKGTAPEVLQPKHEVGTPGEVAAKFSAARERTIEYVRTTSEDLRAHVFKHPAFGDLDGYQWVLLLSGHCERHTAQIKEVMANAAFPKK